MDALSTHIGAQRGERNPERFTHCNPHRSQTWDTGVGAMELRIASVREGSYLLSLVELRWRSEKAMLAVIQQATVEGVSTSGVSTI